MIFQSMKGLIVDQILNHISSNNSLDKFSKKIRGIILRHNKMWNVCLALTQLQMYDCEIRSHMSHFWSEVLFSNLPSWCSRHKYKFLKNKYTVATWMWFDKLDWEYDKKTEVDNVVLCRDFWIIRPEFIFVYRSMQWTVTDLDLLSSGLQGS